MRKKNNKSHQPKVFGRPRRCTNKPGSKACKKMKGKNNSLCRACKA